MFYIFDCNDCIVGNSKGYKRHKDALMIATKIERKLWQRYDDKILKYKQDNISPSQWDRTVYKISE